MLSLVAAALLFTGVQEQAPEPNPADERRTETAEPRDPNADRVVCRRERVLGSNRPQRVCMTRRERAELRDAARNLHDRLMQDQPNPSGEAAY